MLPCFDIILQNIEQIIKLAPCKYYDTIDRIGILQYRSCLDNTYLPEVVTLAIQSHLSACQEKSYTRLKDPVFVFCSDSLKNIAFINSIDLEVALKKKLGKEIFTYQELVSWYLSLCHGD